MSVSYKWEPIARVYDPLKAGSIDSTDTTPHDHGIVRAMQADYKPNRLVVGDPKCTVFIGRLNHNTSEGAIKRVFSHCGDIKRLRLIRDIVTGSSRGYAFVEYYDKYDAVKAVRDLHMTILDEREIFLEMECERLLPGWVPRRLGGGLSGKKESGQLRFGGRDRPFKKPLLPFKCQQRRQNYRESDDRERSSDRYRYRN